MNVVREATSVSQEEIMSIFPVLKKMSKMSVASLSDVLSGMDETGLQKFSKALHKTLKAAGKAARALKQATQDQESDFKTKSAEMKRRLVPSIESSH